MDNRQSQFQKVLGLGIFKILPSELRYDPLIGKPSDKHWVVARGDLQNISCEKKLVGYTLRVHTQNAIYDAAPAKEEDVLRIISIVMPEKLQTDPLLLDMQRHRDDLAFREQQRAYEQQLEAHHKSLQPEQLVRTYKGNPEKDFQRDAARLAREGWAVQSQTAGGLKREGVVSIVTVGLAGKRKVGEITVVYTRPRRPVPMPTPPQQMMPIAPTVPATTISLPQSQPVPSVPSASQPDHLAQLEKLSELHQRGILTNEEFAAKKAEILARM